MNIFVGKVAYAATEEGIRKEFEVFGIVSKVTILIDRITKIPRGFAFVEMASKEEGDAAIVALNGKEFLGMVLNVSEARPKAEAGKNMNRNQDDHWNSKANDIRKRY